MIRNHVSGIFDNEDFATFLFLDPEKPLGVYIPAFQAFETSLLMIALGRWTNALISINSAIENLLRSDAGESNNKDFATLINQLSIAYGLSNDLKNCAHRVRKKRNEVVHQSLIPQDNNESISLYMSDALSVFKVFAERICGVDLYKCLDETISKNLVFTKNTIQSLEIQQDLSLILSLLVKTVANYTHPMLSPNLLLESPDEYASWAIQSTLEDAEIWIEDTWRDMTFQHRAVSCPAACQGLLSVGFWDASSQKCELASCPRCGLTIIPDLVLQTFVQPYLRS